MMEKNKATEWSSHRSVRTARGTHFHRGDLSRLTRIKRTWLVLLLILSFFFTFLHLFSDISSSGASPLNFINNDFSNNESPTSEIIFNDDWKLGTSSSNLLDVYSNTIHEYDNLEENRPYWFNSSVHDSANLTRDFQSGKIQFQDSGFGEDHNYSLTDDLKNSNQYSNSDFTFEYVNGTGNGSEFNSTEIDFDYDYFRNSLYNYNYSLYEQLFGGPDESMSHTYLPDGYNSTYDISGSLYMYNEFPKRLYLDNWTYWDFETNMFYSDSYFNAYSYVKNDTYFDNNGERISDYYWNATHIFNGIETAFGYYYGTHDFNATMDEGFYYGSPDNFNEDPVGAQDTDIAWVDRIEDSDANIEVMSEIDGHKNILKYSVDSNYKYVQHDFPSAEVSGSREVWLRVSQIDKYVYFEFKGDGSNSLSFLFKNNGMIGYYDDTTLIEIESYSADTWYHYRFDWDCGLGTWDLYINGVKKGTYDLEGSPSTLSYVELNTIIGAELYIDAWGDPADEGYSEGYNLNPYDITQVWDTPFNTLYCAHDSWIRIVDEIDGHSDVLDIYDGTNSLDDDMDEIGGSIVFSAQTTGSVEWWQCRDASDSKAFIFTLRGNYLGRCYLKTDNDAIYYYPEGGSWTLIEGSQFLAGEWFHIRIDFDSSSNTFDFYMNGTLLGDDLQYRRSDGNTDIDELYFITTNTAEDYHSYLDALGFSWDSTSHYGVGYELGYNLNPYDIENMLLNSFDYLYCGHDSWINVTDEVDGHKEVLTLYDGTGSMDDSRDEVGGYISFDAQTSGTIEFWIRGDDVSSSIEINIRASANGIRIRIVAGKIWYMYGNVWHTATGGTLNDDEWYHFRIDFDCDSDVFDFYLNGYLLDTAVPFQVLKTQINVFEIITGNSAHDYTYYLDAIGFSWDPNYEIRINRYPAELRWDDDITYVGSSVDFLGDQILYIDLDFSEDDGWDYLDGDYLLYFEANDTLIFCDKYFQELWTGSYADGVQLTDVDDYIYVYKEVEGANPFDVAIDYLYLLDPHISNKLITYYIYSVPEQPDDFVLSCGNFLDHGDLSEIDDDYSEIESGQGDGGNIYHANSTFDTGYDGWTPFSGSSGSQTSRTYDGSTHDDVVELYYDYLSLDYPPELTQTISTQTGQFTIEYWVKMESGCYGDAHLRAILGPELVFYETQIKAYDGASLTLVKSISADTWYHIRLDIDTDADTYDLYVNSELVADDFEHVSAGVSSLEFTTNTGAFGELHARVDAIGFSWNENYEIGDNRYLAYYYKISTNFTISMEDSDDHEAGNTLNNLTLYYSYYSNISTTITLRAWNFDKEEWFVVNESINNVGFFNMYYNLNSSFINSTHDTLLNLTSTRYGGVYFKIFIDELTISYNMTKTNYKSSSVLSKSIKFDFLNYYDTGYDDYLKLYAFTYIFKYKFITCDEGHDAVCQFNDQDLTKDGTWHVANFMSVYDSTSLDGTINCEFNVSNGYLLIRYFEYSMWFGCINQTNSKRVLAQYFALEPVLSELTDLVKDNGRFHLNITYEFVPTVDAYEYANGFGRTNFLEIHFGLKLDGNWYFAMYPVNSLRIESYILNISSTMDALGCSSFEDFSLVFIMIGNSSYIDVESVILYDLRATIPAQLNFTMTGEMTDREEFLDYLSVLYEFTADNEQFVALYIHNFQTGNYELIDHVLCNLEISMDEWNTSATSQYYNANDELLFYISCENYSIAFSLNLSLTLDYRTYVFLSYQKIFYQRCVWRYRFVLTSYGMNYYTEWINFDVGEREPNFRAVSESEYTTQWLLNSEETTDVEAFHDDLTYRQWLLECNSDDSFDVEGYLNEDSHVNYFHHGTNYGTSQYLITNNTGDYYFRSTFDTGYDGWTPFSGSSGSQTSRTYDGSTHDDVVELYYDYLSLDYPPELSRTITTQAGMITIEYWVKMSSSCYGDAHLRAIVGPEVVFYETQIKAYDGASLTLVKSTSANTWYHVLLYLNTDTDMYDLYINGELVADDFDHASAGVSNLEFTSNTGAFGELYAYVDDVSVRINPTGNLNSIYMGRDFGYLYGNYTDISELGLYVEETYNGDISINKTTGFDEDTITWDNKPDSLEYHDDYSVSSYNWYWLDVVPSDYYVISNENGTTEIRSSEYGVVNFRPYVKHHLSKIYHNATEGYAYMQTNQYESLTLAGPEYLTNYSMFANDYFLINLTSTMYYGMTMQLYYEGALQKELTLTTTGAINFNNRIVEILIDEPVIFDQIKFTGILEEAEYFMIYDIKAYNLETNDDSYLFYVAADGALDTVILNTGNYTLKIYENGIKKVEKTISITYDLLTEIYTPNELEYCRLTLVSQENDLLEFNLFHVTYTRWYMDERVTEEMIDNTFYCDLDSEISFIIYDRFDNFIDNETVQSSSYLEIEIEVFTLKISHRATENSTIIIWQTTSDYYIEDILTPDELVEYTLIRGYYHVNWSNGENAELTEYAPHMTEDKLLILPSAYYSCYIGCFNFDGLGLNPEWVRLYINNVRSDFGLNTLKYDWTNFVVLDYFNQTLLDETVYTRQYTEYNLYVQVYTLIINNNFTHSIRIKIERTGTDIYMKQVIPAQSGLEYRFLPNVEYKISAYYLNGSKIDDRLVLLDDNNHIVSFGWYTEERIPEIPDYGQIIRNDNFVLTIIMICVMFALIILIISIIAYRSYKQKERMIKNSSEINRAKFFGGVSPLSKLGKKD